MVKSLDMGVARIARTVACSPRNRTTLGLGTTAATGDGGHESSLCATDGGVVAWCAGPAESTYASVVRRTTFVPRHTSMTTKTAKTKKMPCFGGPQHSIFSRSAGV